MAKRIGFSYALTTTYTDVNRIKTGRTGPTSISNIVVYPSDSTINVGFGDKVVLVVFCHDTLEAWEVTVAGVAQKKLLWVRQAGVWLYMQYRSPGRVSYLQAMSTTHNN